MSKPNKGEGQEYLEAIELAAFPLFARMSDERRERVGAAMKRLDDSLREKGGALADTWQRRCLDEWLEWGPLHDSDDVFESYVFLLRLLCQELDAAPDTDETAPADLEAAIDDASLILTIMKGKDRSG